MNAALLGSVENSRKIGREMVRAYGAGSHRVLGAIDRRWQVVARPVKAMNEPLHARMQTTGKRVVGFAQQGVKMAATGASKAVDAVCNTAEAVLTRVNKRAARLGSIDNPYASHALRRLEHAGLAGARFGRDLTGRMADGAVKLAEAVAGETTRRATPTRRRKARA
ncbi:MAG: hypothetical protein WCE48_03615 [Steroidobacteraceae bacterium]